ncbi:MAG: NAD(P)/FAD-dependent oxidoreductase, partial [Dehalococcoidia bacterium]
GVANVLDTLLPRSICPTLCALAGVDPAARAARLSRTERRALAALVTALPLSVTGRRNGEEFVTAGGVRTDEVDPRTMESRLVPGLYFAGEVLDADGFTGGYNLQAAWATGQLAGLAAVAGLQR